MRKTILIPQGVKMVFLNILTRCFNGLFSLIIVLFDDTITANLKEALSNDADTRIPGQIKERVKFNEDFDCEAR